MAMYWKTPGGERSVLYTDLLNQTHLLIAGATGAGKSTVVNGIIHAALFNSPAKVQFILIDPKSCELDEYKHLPHVLKYADALPDCVNALEYAMNIVNARMREMKKRKARLYDGSDVYVIIDELMVLMTREKKRALPVMQDILSLARCAKVHLIACTQSPIAKVIPTELKCNFDSRLALRTVSAQDSRNIIGISGCEQFPNPVIDHKALGYYRRGAVMDVHVLPMIQPDAMQAVLNHWKKNRKPHFKFGRL